jgi:hypothetical protein
MAEEIEGIARPAHCHSQEEGKDRPRATMRLPAGRMRAVLESMREFHRGNSGAMRIFALLSSAPVRLTTVTPNKCASAPPARYSN